MMIHLEEECYYKVEVFCFFAITYGRDQAIFTITF